MRRALQWSVGFLGSDDFTSHQGTYYEHPYAYKGTNEVSNHKGPVDYD
jgi:hypothetical protein